MLPPDEPLLNPSVQIIFGLYRLEVLFLLVYIYDIAILILGMPLDKVFKNITLADSTRADQCNDVVLSYPGINDICIMLSCQNLHNSPFCCKYINFIVYRQ